MSVVVDTTVLVDVLRGDRAALDFLGGLERPPWCSEVSRVEIIRGLRSRERPLADRLFAELGWVPVDEPVARAAGEFGRKIRASHRGVGPMDLIVAATASVLEIPLATANVKHYPMFPRLKRPY
jgi:predicted nucleic acid-binding protein